MAFKDCFMSTLETAYELRDSVKFLLASPDIVPIPGWPYQEMLASLTGDKEPGPVAEAILEALGKHYEVEENRFKRQSVPYSLIDTSSLPKPSEALDSVTAKLVASASARKALAASANDPALIDVGVLCQKLKARGKPPVTEEADKLENALRKVVRQSVQSVEPPLQTRVQARRADKRAAVGRRSTAGAAGTRLGKRMIGLCLFRYPSSESAVKNPHIAGHATRRVLLGSRHLEGDRLDEHRAQRDAG